jgi:thioredoxin-like negative regulator of GroEL
MNLVSTAPDAVVDFTAPSWCRPCQQFAPHFDKAAETSDATFIAVDVDKAPWAMQDFGVRGVPTVARFQNGERVDDLKARTVVALLNEINS